MDEQLTRIMRALKKHHDEEPTRFVFISSLLSELAIPFDADLGTALAGLQKQGLVDIMSTSNIRIRLTDKGADQL